MGKELRGKEVVEILSKEIMTQVSNWKSKGYPPKMATILVEGDPASFHYMQSKKRAAEKLGIGFELHTFSNEISEEVLLKTIANEQELNG